MPLSLLFICSLLFSLLRAWPQRQIIVSSKLNPGVSAAPVVQDPDPDQERAQAVKDASKDYPPGYWFSGGQCMSGISENTVWGVGFQKRFDDTAALNASGADYSHEGSRFKFQTE
ncbi:hypothetical protein K438DRAFT_1774406 [Mycena galopus ATCC 62051]|nr:hypothetical protein K438DRAFT_1774406 [Mycena galopus ATCC 62051]